VKRLEENIMYKLLFIIPAILMFGSAASADLVKVTDRKYGQDYYVVVKSSNTSTSDSAAVAGASGPEGKLGPAGVSRKPHGSLNPKLH
jgi:hypothetical protein